MTLTPLSAGFQSLPPLPTSKLGLSSADSRVGGLVHTLSRPLWVSPMNSSVRLGVSPADTSTPTGVFNQRFEALFSCAGAPDCAICFDPLPSLLVYLCMNVSRRICQPPPSGVCQLQPGPPRSTICHLTGSATHRLATSPLHPAARLHPSYQSR